MLIVETPTFTKQIARLLSEEEYRELQNRLLDKPDAGKVIKGTRGLRKMRFAMEGRGKRGGGRLIYYWLSDDHILYMIYAYPKNEGEDLTEKQYRHLAKHVEEFIHERKRI